MMELKAAFSLILKRTDWKFSVDELLAYAAEDTFGGADTGVASMGVSVREAEGKLLYALVRALKPERCLEIGCADGCSARHITEALKRNQSGFLTSVDIDALAGRLVEDRSRWKLVVGDAAVVDIPVDYDFVFEDGSHGLEDTVAFLARFGSAPVVISHDYDYYAVKRAWIDTYGRAILPIRLPNSNAGMALHTDFQGVQPKRLLVYLPFHPLPFDWEQLRPAPDWEVTVLGQERDEAGERIVYPDWLEFLPACILWVPKRDKHPLVYLHQNLKTLAAQTLAAAQHYDLLFSPMANWLMIDAYHCPIPLVAYAYDFTFERLKQGNFFRVFFWETTYRVAERAALTIFPDDIVRFYAEQHYPFKSCATLLDESFFTVFERILCAS